MEIIEFGAALLSEKLGLNVDKDTVSAALSQLLGDGQGGIDLGGLVSRMTQSGDLSSLVNTWLGDGANGALSPSSLTSLLGDDALSKFSSILGSDTGSTTEALADVLPQMMDSASSGGSLLDAAGGLGGLLGAAKSFLT